MGLSKSLAVGLFVAAGVVGVAALPPSVALAKPPTSCDPNSSVMTIDGTQSVRVTHVGKYEVAPGAKQATADVKAVGTLKASVTPTIGGEVSSEAVMAAAASFAGTTLAAVGEVADPDATDVEAQVSPARFNRYFAAYSARHVWSGTYTVIACDASGTAVSTVKAGTWVSFSPVSLASDGALCAVGKNRRTAAYEVGSAPYLACRSTWWS